MAIRKRGMERKMQKTKKQIESFALESSFSSEMRAAALQKNH